MLTTCDFRFVCPMDWDAMADLPDGSGKHCDHCQRSVVTVHNRRQFAAAAKRGDCVAYLPEGEDTSHRLTGEPDETVTIRLMGVVDPPPRKRRGKVESRVEPGVALATRVLFRDTGDEVGTIARDATGRLVATCERLEWILETPIDLGPRRIYPNEDDFLDHLPLAYSGSLFRAEIVERADGWTAAR